MHLKECPSCHNILKSVCSKSGCLQDGRKPVMIAAASAQKTNKKHDMISDDDDDDNFNTDSNDDFSSDDNESMSIDEDKEDKDTIESMKKVWAYLSLPNKEGNLIGKWFAVCYKGKRNETLYISKVIACFLQDENGPVDKLIMRSLKPKFGSGTILEDTPAHLPHDECQFDLYDVIAGPLKVDPLKGSSKFDVPSYEKVKKIFSLVKKHGQKEIVAYFFFF